MPKPTNLCAGTSISLKEARRILEETVADMPGVVREALEAWLAVEQQLPQHPPNPYTAAAVQVLQAAYQMGHAGVSGEDGVIWLKQHVHAVSTSIAEHFDKQMEITAKRIQVMMRLGEGLQQQPVGGKHNSQLAAQMIVEEQACNLLGSALHAHRAIGAAAAVVSALTALEDVAAGGQQRRHWPRQKVLSREVSLVDSILADMWGQMKAYADLTTRFCEMHKQLPLGRRATDVEISTALRGEGVAATAALRVWLPAAVKFPANTRACQAMLNTAEWCALLRHSYRNEQLRHSGVSVVLSVLARKDLRDSTVRDLGRQFIRALLYVYQVTDKQIQALQVPNGDQQDLLGCLREPLQTWALRGAQALMPKLWCPSFGKAAPSMCDGQVDNSHSISDAHAEVHMHVKQQGGVVGKAGARGDSSSSSSAEHAAAGAGAGAGDDTDNGDSMQELLHMMYGMSVVGTQ